MARLYANLAWARQLGNNVVTNQYLLDADEFAYTKNNWVYADHSQLWTGSGGASYLWYGTRFSADLIYGGGLRSGFANTDHLPPYAQVNAGISHEYDIPGWSPVTVRFNVVNVFDTSYVLKNGTGIGVFANAYGPRIGYYFGVAQKFGPGAMAKKKPTDKVPRLFRHPADAIWTWTGFYVGGNVGYSISRFGNDTSFSDASLGTPLAAESSYVRHYGALGGGQAGYNWQLGIWVAGIEADMQFGHQRTTTGAGCDGTVCNTAFTPFDAPVTLIHEHNLDWFGTVRGRLGAAVSPDVLPYVTGGLVYGEVEHLGNIYGMGLDASGNPVFAGNMFVSRQLRAGWTVGGGIEARLFGNVTGRVEYLHVDLGEGSVPVSSPLNATPINIVFRSRISEDLVRLGINYKFDPYALVDASPAGVSAAPARARVRTIAKAPAPGALWTWTGFYFGANAGYAAGSFAADAIVSDATLGTPLLATSSSSSLKGGSGGIGTGYNLQIGTWLAGLEADAQFSTQRMVGSALCPGAVCNPGIVGFDAPVTVALRNSLGWFGTVRGRFGALVSPDMVAYVTGGLAVGGIEHAADTSGFSVDADGNPVQAPNSFVARTVKAGWTVGGGIEARIAGNVTGKVEYLHMDFGADSAATLNNQNALPIVVTVNSRLANDVVRLGINYKFDPNAPAPTAATAVPDKTLMIFKTPVATVWTWSGYYLGLNAGYSWGRSATDAFFNDATLPGAAFATGATFGIDGKVFGMQTGYNFQAGWWLFGMEADAQLTAQHANPKFVCPGTICNPAGPVVASFDQSQKLEWFSTLRARFGMAITPKIIAYVTGGAAVAGLQTSGNMLGYDPTGTPALNPFSTVTVNAGWTVGGGAEARIIGNWTSKVEYLYVDLGSMTTGVNNQLNTTATAAFNSRLVDHIVHAGLNYKFD